MRPRFACALLLLLPIPAAAASLRDPSHAFCGTERGGAAAALWAHREQEQRQGPAGHARDQALTGAADHDAGQVAVLVDEGDLLLKRNAFDLSGAGIEIVRAGGGYTATRVDRPVVADAGSALALGDDAAVDVPLPFEFPFYGGRYARVFVHSDGNLTFGAADPASSERSLGRFLSGPPRIAPLFSDLNPEAGGSVTASGDAGGFRVTWNGVPRYGFGDHNTFQVTLRPDGRIEMAWTQAASDVEQAVVGLAPGAYAGGLTAADLSQAAGVASAGALAENFRADAGLDPVAVTRKFYASHPDDYQQIVVFTSQRLRGSDYFAYELTVKNADRGIGDDLVDYASAYGSAGRLESFVTMDYVMKYPEDPEQVFLGTNSTLSVMGQEIGHRWGAYARFQDGPQVSSELLGRDAVHWSFFLDSDASHLEGNDIQDLGGGRFRTVGATLRYSALDQYLMGLRPAAEVPPFFFVRAPQVAFGSTSSGREPQVGVDIAGTRKDVTIGDVIAALGPRDPAPGPRPPFREAFVYVDASHADPAVALARIERYRAAWEAFFARSTDGRGAVDTRLR